MKKNRKRVLVHAYLARNLGDDLFVKILAERYPDIDWSIIVTDGIYKDIFRNYKNIKVLHPNLFWRMMKKLKIHNINDNYVTSANYEAMLFLGGSIFIQRDPFQPLYFYRQSMVDDFIQHNKPVYVLGSNFGPYTDPDFMVKYKHLLTCCEDICFREQHTYNMFNDLKNIRLAPDVVFGLKMSPAVKEKNTVGFSLMNLKERKLLAQYDEIYIRKIRELIEYRAAQNKKITMYSFCEVEGDLACIKEALAPLNPNCKKDIRVLNYTGDFNRFLADYQKQEAVIGTRFHAVILSLLFDQGVYPIIYSDKTYNVLCDISLNKEYTYIKNMEQLDPEHVMNVIYNNRMRERSFINEAERQFEGLDRFAERD